MPRSPGTRILDLLQEGIGQILGRIWTLRSGWVFGLRNALERMLIPIGDVVREYMNGERSGPIFRAAPTSLGRQI